MASTFDQSWLCRELRLLPETFDFRYTEIASTELIRKLFQSLCADRLDYLDILFPNGHPPFNARWSLSESQGAVEGTEYTEAARGHPCGHIFKAGEATYRCRTCGTDDTCVLCAKCYDASDHEGHPVSIFFSGGNAGCCDCGDSEAWSQPMHCVIHTAKQEAGSSSAGKGKDVAMLPPDLVESIQLTISRVMDYILDVWSCSPEQLRLPKTVFSVEEDYRLSRLSPEVYGGPDAQSMPTEYALVLWNDEKHTVDDVQNIVARACKTTIAEGKRRAEEIDIVGRSIIQYSADLNVLLKAAKILEQPKLSVSIRSARDLFREQMCGTIIEWISDIAGCKVGSDAKILRTTICEEMLKEWSVGSEAHHKIVGDQGLYDHSGEEVAQEITDTLGIFPSGFLSRLQQQWRPSFSAAADPDAEEEEESDEQTRNEEDDGMDIDEQEATTRDSDVPMDGSDVPEDYLEAQEATMAGYPPPPPPPTFARHRDNVSLSISDEGEGSEPLMTVPQTQTQTPKAKIVGIRPPKYWLEKPSGYTRTLGSQNPSEDLWKRVRLDFLILYDLRMWKQLRTDIRDVLISTVNTVPEFKRLLGLRFASIYTVLAELHLIADREPDYSIITLSLQMLTTASITAEIVEKGNFLTNLMAILYTFLTTRQVGYPSDINLNATLAVDQGVVFNRRAQHFYQDMKYLLHLDAVRGQIRTEQRYLLQFLDIAKIHQGICPNVRAIGEHLEYEMEAWMSVANVTSEIMKLCRAISDSFVVRTVEDMENLHKGIRTAAGVAIINSIGSERRRFEQAEIKRPVRFKSLEPFEFDDGAEHRIVDYNVETEPMSCYHALHYTLSWLIDRCKSMPAEQLRRWLHFTAEDLRQIPMSKRAFLLILEYHPQENLLAMFDFPIRVCAWMAQMRAGMWVRNGLSLRHQIQQYKSIPKRELTYQRDLFMVQTAMVICDPATIFATMVDRFDLTEWVRGNYQPHESREEAQTIDVAEDFIHLLIVLLCDRLTLFPDKQISLDGAQIRRDLVHALCFKPLSFTELNKHLKESVQESEEHLAILHEMTTFRPPEGMTDHGTFTLKDEYFELVDPYLPYLSRNQREEAENLYRKCVAKKSGKDPSEIAYEPKIRVIESGLFKDLSAFTNTPLFAQMIFYFIQYAMMAPSLASEIAATKIEQFLHFVLHLVLVAVMLDPSDENSMLEDTPQSFCHNILTKKAQRAVSGDTVAALLRRSTEMEHIKGCAPKVKLILRHLRRKRPTEYDMWTASLNLPMERYVDSPAPSDVAGKELKKKQALDRQARVMAQFKEQQDNFLQNQTYDWGADDFSDFDDADVPIEEEKVWDFPSGSCILCQEKTNNDKLFGTFALISESRIFRNTDLSDESWICEVIETPTSLDRSAEAVRPFGVAGKNKRLIQKTYTNGKVIELERQDLAKGYPSHQTSPGPISTGCGHIMHFSCFEVYIQATQRRHAAQIARHHPENTHRNEFLCPLCKALGNTFLPIIWKGKKHAYPGPLATESKLTHFLESELSESVARYPFEPKRSLDDRMPVPLDPLFLAYGESEFIPPLALELPHFSVQRLLKSTFRDIVTADRLPGLPFGVEIRDREVDLTVGLNGTVLSGLSQESSSSGITTLKLMELDRVYARLQDTLRLNKLVGQQEPPFRQELTWPEHLAKSLGSSITSVEIFHRGTVSDEETNILDKINSLPLTHLKVLAETITSYVTIGALANGGANSMYSEYNKRRTAQMRTLFLGHPELYKVPVEILNASHTYPGPPLLEQDPFVLFAEYTLCCIPSQRLDVKSVMKMFYIAEVVRVILAFVSLDNKLDKESDEMRSRGEAEDPIITEFLGFIPGFNLRTRPRLMSRIIRAYALPFLRKCTILMHVRYSIDFPASAALAVRQAGTRTRASYAPP